MNRNVPRLVPFAIALLAAPALAMAQSAPDEVTLHQNGQTVHVTSVEPDSIVGGYRIDFAKLDHNHDGYISRAEAKADPTLYAEFDAVDVHHHGRLSKADLQGWMAS